MGKEKTPEEWQDLRNAMVEEQLVSRGVGDPLTLRAMRDVPRHLFVPSYLREEAYSDYPLPIGEGQTISQPYIVAIMTAYAHLQSTSIVLEIGTGSGYAAAVAGRIVTHVYTMERVGSLAKEAAGRLESLGYRNVTVRAGDGTRGWPEKAPFDAILVTAGAPVVPESLLKQLRVDGRLVIPVGDHLSQELLVIHKKGEGDAYEQERKEYVRFVPLIGEEGW